MPGSRRRATLNLAAGGLAVALMLTACADDGGEGSAPGDSSGSPSPGASEGPVEVEVEIDSGQVSPTIGRVPLDIGDEMRLSVTSDAADTIHVHGVDRTLILEPNVEGEIDFVVPPGVPRGVYAVETHGGGLILFEIKIR
jgi:hypothetical protein